MIRLTFIPPCKQYTRNILSIRKLIVNWIELDWENWMQLLHKFTVSINSIQVSYKIGIERICHVRVRALFVYPIKSNSLVSSLEDEQQPPKLNTSNLKSIYKWKILWKNICAHMHNRILTHVSNALLNSLIQL